MVHIFLIPSQREFIYLRKIISYMKKTFILYAVIILFASSCVKNEMEFTYEKSFAIGNDSWPIITETIFGDKLRQTLEGNGWQWVEGKTIKDGKVTEEDYYQQIIGSRTVDYYFHDGIVTSYIAPDFYPAMCYWDQSIRYDDEHNDLWIGAEKLRIVNIDSNHFAAIDNVATKNDGTKVFVLNTWRKMNDAELRHCKETFTQDFSELLDKL